METPPGYADELGQVREFLEDRFDDIESGRIAPIDGEEAFRLLMERTDAQRRKQTA